VETGVQHGKSSVFILQALAENQFGRLYSIDLPSGALPDGKESGWLVPSGLRLRWDLTIGASRDVLPDVMNRSGGVDVFIHDSEHTYETMMFEYGLGMKHLKQGGILLSDDTSRNNAFIDFCHMMRQNQIGLRKGSVSSANPCFKDRCG